MITAKKSLGQNFLIDKKILDRIANITKIENKIILEIGPGTGNLTSFILQKKPKKFIVIEKDLTLVKNLNTFYSEKLEIINDDILNIMKIRYLVKKLQYLETFLIIFLLKF